MFTEEWKVKDDCTEKLLILYVANESIISTQPVRHYACNANHPLRPPTFPSHYLAVEDTSTYTHPQTTHRFSGSGQFGLCGKVVPLGDGVHHPGEPT